ncbi:hypothetical protein A2477_02020 [Candidatus Falkowbacteria bacterium RIFOXYC2_FULL_47_12]|uniref:Uncharacterized protein n=1 Tax=Candidatus Falkowbacteria bacterium RIFOXYC2_FULL_47_12 TaxID=1798004 RepID=A0A1F5TMG0_9BACT|nr:MAG: hypothetical protein A2477_02020 [Candidatus Falkowbacteria bacterium RIFOXYC2_FULL_47_12]
MLKFLSFFKKNKNTPAESDTKATPADETLAAITYHTMPKKFINAAGSGGMHHTKKWGMVIVGGGGVVLIAGVVFLVWYIFFAPLAVRPVAVSQTPTPAATSVSTPPEAQVSTTPEETAESGQTATPATGDVSEKDCGATAVAAEAGSMTTDSVLACVGERIVDGCKPAAASIETQTVSGIRLAVLGLRQDSCLVQLTYPAPSAISDAALQDYANTYLRCPYNVAGLTSQNYTPAQLAQYVYAQSALEGMTEGRNCEGSAFTLWLERGQRAAVAEETAASSSPSSLAGNFVAGVDTDGDGLTDIEESTIFATSAANPDTDGDTYSDGTEVLNGYNPAGEGTLTDSGLAASYENTAYGYHMLYPKDWRVEDAANGENVIFFSNQSGFIQIIAQANADQQEIEQWYENVNETAPKSAAETLKNGFAVVYSPDGLTAYLTQTGGGDYVYVITYSPGEDQKLAYRTTFQMMIQTLTP